MVRKIAIVVMFFVCMWMLSGCNTMHGIGKDVERGGEAIERSSGK
jgi:entericidin B